MKRTLHKSVVLLLIGVFIFASCSNVKAGESLREIVSKIDFRPKQVEVINAEFPGGEVAMNEFIEDNLVYPEIDKELGNQGRVYVQFVIEKDGSLTNIEVVHGVSETLDQEAIRIVRSMQKWKPSESEGEVIRSRVRLPITFVFE